VRAKQKVFAKEPERRLRSICTSDCRSVHQNKKSANGWLVI